MWDITFFSFAVLSCTLVHVCKTETIRKYCCQENEFLWNDTFCSSGQKINLQCDGDVTTLSNDFNEYWNYKIVPNDDGTKTTLHATAGYIIKEEHYCIGNHGSEDFEVALICDEERINMNELEDKSTTNVYWFTSLLVKTLLILNVMSTITLAITIFIYNFLKEVQDIQGNCIFHLSFNMFCMHGGISYFMISESVSILPNTCITSLYIEIYFLLAVFTWSTVLGYHSWIQTKVKIFMKDDKRIHKYKLFGYGVPALMILFCNIAAHAEKLYTKFEFELECYKHQTGILFIFVILPILILSIANCFFFFATQVRLWNSDLLPQHSKKSTTRMLKNRLILNGKLLILTGTTLSLCTVVYAAQVIVGIWDISNGQRVISKLLIILSVSMTTITSAEGIFVFLLVVVFRKRILKGIASTSLSFGNRFIPEKWKTMVDPETTDDSDAENGNESLQHVNL